VTAAKASALGTVIRAMRHEHGLNQVELARRLGKPSATVSAWELGKAMPEAANLVAVAEALETTVSNLLVRSGLQESAPEATEVWPHAEAPDTRRLRAASVRGVSERIPCFGLEEFAVDTDGHWTGATEADVLRSADNADPHSYALNIRGNALYPRFWSGDTVEVVTDAKVSDGDLAVVIHRDGRRWIRRVLLNRRRQTVRCEPLNPSDQSLEFPLSTVLLHLVISVRPSGALRHQRNALYRPDSPPRSVGAG
jgi:transcriptional regulator with XRE-family HTH domain